jgi:5-bromo-4-chloroindolyl phosphate hydrolysis protein
MANGVKTYAKDVKSVSRRKSVISRLEAQLKSKVKTEKKTMASIPLTDSDVNRIKRELETLKSRLG